MQKHTIESLKVLVNSLRTERNNFRAMYENAKDRKEIERLQKKVEEQAKLIAVQDEVISLQKEQAETLKLRVDELERMVFGKHKRKDKDPPGGSGNIGGSWVWIALPIPPKRPPFSYRRKTPEAKDITETKVHTLPECPNCNSILKDRKTVERFTEDIPSLEDIQVLLHRITKNVIETGYCPCCKVRKSGIPISKQTVSIGVNVRRYVCYSTIISRQTYAQVGQVLRDMMGIHLSDGEIVNILEGEKMKLVPEYEAMKLRLQAEEVVHYDETSWPIAKEEQWKYAWAATGAKKESETIFLIGRSRGKWNALELMGKDANAHVGVSDDYGAYRNLFRRHQLCWAHPLRKFRDLKNSPSLPKEKVKYAECTYTAFARLYRSLQETLTEENDHYMKTKEWRTLTLAKKQKKFENAFQKLSIIHPKDPQKLKTLKASLQKNQQSYFTCFSWPWIPSDNMLQLQQLGLHHSLLQTRNKKG